MQLIRENDGRLRWLAALTCIMSLASLLLQYVILIRGTLDTVGPAFATVRFFSYFTILSNMLVVLVTSTAAGDDECARSSFFRTRGCPGRGRALHRRHRRDLLHDPAPSVAAAGRAVVGRYRAALRHAAVVPGVVGVRRAPWRAAMARCRCVGCWFPLAYLLWTFVRGAWVHEYPYPFIDVDALGWPSVLL